MKRSMVKIATAVMVVFATATATAESAFASMREVAHYKIGDANYDNMIDAKDASIILSHYSKISCGETSIIDEYADVNNDGQIDAKDASFVLAFYAHTSTYGSAAWGRFKNYDTDRLVSGVTLSVKSEMSIESTTVDTISSNDKIQFIEEYGNNWYKVAVNYVGVGYVYIEDKDEVIDLPYILFPEFD